MKSSDNSSATPTSPSPDAPERRSFALSGRSRTLDPRTQAVRKDIADIRLAEYVFAPHYAEPVAKIVLRDVMLRQDRTMDSAEIAALKGGERFELLDVTAGTAWGIAIDHGLVGYVAADALGAP